MFDPFYLIVAPIFLLMVTILVAAHEYGHYLFAKLNRMEVEEFSIGFGRKPLVTWMRRGDTVFTIRPWPLGGFVRIKGMIPEVDGSETQVKNGFYSKSPLQRLTVLFAGPLFSVLAGVILLTGAYYSYGDPIVSPAPVVGRVQPGSAAEQGGLQQGDRVLKIDNTQISTWGQMRGIIIASVGQKLHFSVLRGSSTVEKDVTPTLSPSPLPVLDAKGEFTGTMAVQGMIGVLGTVVKRPVGVLEAFGKASEAPGQMVKGIARIFANPKSFGSIVGGPVTMVAETKDAARGGLLDVVVLAAELSISLGILNLLPVPPLDGGQMMIAFAELLRRGRRLSMQIQNAVNAVGLALVAMLIVSVLIVDANRLMPQKHPAPVATAPK
jgi:regulator of sigma E protease